MTYSVVFQFQEHIVYNFNNFNRVKEKILVLSDSRLYIVNEQSIIKHFCCVKDISSSKSIPILFDESDIILEPVHLVDTD